MYKKYFKFISIALAIFLNHNFLSASVRIMPLGDSITYDDRPDDIRDSTEVSGYRNYLWYKLQDDRYGADFVGSISSGQSVLPSFDTDNEGHPGWSSYELSETTYSYMHTSQPDIVLLHIGTNDRKTSVNGVASLLDEVDKYENETGKFVRVLVSKIINRSTENNYAPDFNNNLENLVHDRQNKGDLLSLVHMNTEANLTSSDYADPTHPNQNGYSKMAVVWFDALKTSYTLALHTFPKSIVDQAYIQSVVVDEAKKIVTFTSEVPDSGIQF
jgi:lysophospholipase L1-like esterase